MLIPSLQESAQMSSTLLKPGNFASNFFY